MPGLQFLSVPSASAATTITLVRGKKTIATLGIARHNVGRAWVTWNGKIRRKLTRRRFTSPDPSQLQTA